MGRTAREVGFSKSKSGEKSSVTARDGLFFLLFFMTIFLSFMTENTLLMAIGVAMYSFFLLLSINYRSESPKTDVH